MSDYRTSSDRGYGDTSSSSYRRFDDRRDFDRTGGDQDRYDSYNRREEYGGDRDGYRSGSGDRGSDYYRQERGGANYDSRSDRYEGDRRSDYDRSRYDDHSGERYDDRGGDSYKRREVIKETYVEEGKGRGPSRQEDRDSYGVGGGARNVTTSGGGGTTSHISGGGGYGGGSGGGGTSTYRERVVTSSTSEKPIYRPIVTPRSLVIQRSSVAPYTFRTGGGNRSYSVDRSVHYGYGSRGGFTPEAYGAMTHSNVTSMMESREKEKRDMQDLNERFASYIEKVRFLEAQNRKLADELEKLRASWGKETSAVKAMYQTELEEAKKLLDDSERDKAKLEIRVASLEEQLDETRQREMDARRDADDWRERAEKQNQQLSDQEAEISMLRRRVNAFETDKDKEKKQIAYLTDALNRARFDLDNETLQHVDAENRRQTLEEELEFLKAIHEQEMRELAALAYRDTTPENREFWKNEMGQALREIQQVYDDKLDNIRSEMEFFYNTKIQEYTSNVQRQGGPGSELLSRNKEESRRMRTYISELNEKMGSLDGKNAQLLRELETVRRERDEREREWERENGDLKMEVAKLRAELEAILKELQNIMNAKMGLELEIEAYRKLLESEETRLLRRAGEGYGGKGGLSGDGGTKPTFEDRRDKPTIGGGGYGGGGSGGGSYGGGGATSGGGGSYGGGGATGGGGGYGGGGATSGGGGSYGGGGYGGGSTTGDGGKLPPKDNKPITGGGGGGAGGRGGLISGGSGGGGSSGGMGRGETPGGKPLGPSQVGPGRDDGGAGRGGIPSGRGGFTQPTDTSGRGGANARGGRGSYTGGRGGSYAGRGGAGGGGASEQKITPKVDPKTQATPWHDDDYGRHEPHHQTHPPHPTDRTPSRTSFQRSSKGPVSVAECAPDGKFITLENTGQKDEFIGGWMLSRAVDDHEKVSTVFPSELVLRSGEKMRVWARGTKPLNASALDIESNIPNWGVGANAATKLTNIAGEERATHVQKTTY